MNKIKAIIFALVIIIAGLLATYQWLESLPKPEGIPILAYHMVSDRDKEDAKAYNVPPEEFREQMQYIIDEGYQTITPLEFMKAKKGKLELPPKPIIITFDDGYEDNHRIAVPILEEMGMKAIIYMVTNEIGNEGYLTWEQLHDLERRGMELGSHTANHLALTKLTDEELRAEVKLSKLIMEWNGLKTIFSLSYPNGAYDERMPAILASEEYLTAVTGDSGLNTFSTNPYLLHRINVPRPYFGLDEFRLRFKKAELMAKFYNWLGE